MLGGDGVRKSGSQIQFSLAALSVAEPQLQLRVRRRRLRLGPERQPQFARLTCPAPKSC